MSKYIKLWEHIKNTNKPELTLSFDQIMDICGFKIDHSFLSLKKELNDFSYEVVKISMKEKKILFKKNIVIV